MNYYKKLRLDELGITSDEEAEELEYELEVRFEEFTAKDRQTWLQQNAYLEFFSRIGTVTSAAREAGVTVYKAQTWKFDNVLGFTRRLEVADLAFNDRLKEKALRRASDPKAPATLLIELLRAYMPEQFSRNGHKCDTSKSDEILSPGGGEIGLCRVEGWVVVVMGAFMRGSRRRGVTGLAWHKWAWRDRLWIPACAGMTGGRCWLVRQGFACVAGLDVVG